MRPSLLTSSHGRWQCFDIAQPRRESLAELAEGLVSLAREQKVLAYCPYSRFRVGAAVRMGERVFCGANVENASYGATMCAERTAIFCGNAAGERRITVLALSTDAAPGSPLESRSPCGMCRQVISEFADDETIVIIDGGTAEGVSYVGEIIPWTMLLPWSFRLGR
jgi:cytidine deaminase